MVAPPLGGPVAGPQPWWPQAGQPRRDPVRVCRARAHFELRDVDGSLIWEGDSLNVITTAQIDFFHLQVYGTSALNSTGLCYVGCSADLLTETSASTQLTSEIAANGFSRALATYTHTAGTSVTQLQVTFTATGSQHVEKVALFSASSGGTMGHVLAVNAPFTATAGQTFLCTFTLVLGDLAALATGLSVTSTRLFLYKFNRTVAGDYTLNDAGPNARNATSETGTTHIAPFAASLAAGTVPLKRARRFSANSVRLACPNTGGDAAAVQGSCTLKLWVNYDSVTGATQAILAYSGDSGVESLATNAQAALRLNASGVLQMDWEQSAAGTNITATDPSSTVVAVGALVHLATVMTDDELNVGKKKVTFYVQGVNKGVVRNLTGPNGGTSAQWTVGNLIGAATIGLAGCVRSLVAKSVADDDATIAADAARTTGTNAYTHVDSSNVLVHYICDEFPDQLDECGNFHLRRLQGNAQTVAGTLESVDPLFDDSGRALHLDGSTEYQGSSYLNSLLTAACGGSGTLQFLMRGGDNLLAANRGVWNLGGDHSTDVSSSNYFAIDILTTGFVQQNLEHGAGVNASVNSTAALFDSTNRLNRLHVAVTWATSGGTTTFRHYVNGQQVGGTTAAITAFDGGSAARPWIGVGDTVTNRMLGYVDEMAMDNVQMTAAQILASYQACVPN